MALSSSLRDLAKGLGAAAWEYDPATAQLLWSEGPLTEWFGARALAAGAGPRAWLAGLEREDRRTALRALRRAQQEAPDLRVRLPSPSGSVRTVRVRMTPDQSGRVLGWCEPLPEEAALRGSGLVPPPGLAAPNAEAASHRPSRAEEPYRTYIEQAQQAIWCLEASPPIPLDLPQGEIERRIYSHMRLVECNPAFRAAFLPPGMRRPAGRQLMEFPGTWLPATRRMVGALARSRFAKSDSLISVQRGTGRVRNVHLRTESVMQDGAFLRMWCSAQDVTTQVRETERLARSEQETRTLLAQAASGIAILDRRRKLVAFNASLERALGRSLESQQGQVLRLEAEPSQELALSQLLDEARAQGSSTKELYVRRPGLGNIELEASARFEETLDGRFYLVVRDVSERRRTQRELSTKQRQVNQLARLHTVGQMATRIAHELNQPLAAILNYVQGSLHRLPRDEDYSAVRAALESASEQARRAGASLKGLRSFASQGAPVRIELDVETVLTTTVELFSLQPVAQEHELETTWDVSGAKILADPDQIQQVLLALLENAAEACKAPRGTVQLRARIEARESPKLVIEITDDGDGISDSDIERLFVAFESTKPGSLGLGLSISRSIIEAHQGRLRCVRSSPGRTVFSICLALSHPSP